MRISGAAFLLIAILPALGFSQEPKRAPKPDPRVTRPDERERPPTPQQILQDEIRRFDPLDKDDEEEEDDQKKDDKRVNQPAKPLPGSLAEEARNSAQSTRESTRGPKVLTGTETAPAQEEYTGPAVLSRSYTLGKPSIPQDVNWSESLGFGFSFNSGAAPATSTQPGGARRTGNLYGTVLNWSISGRKLWAHDLLTVSGYGQYQRNFPSYGIYNGPNTTLAVSLLHVVSRRIRVTLTGNGVVLSQNYSLQNPTASAGTSIANLNVSASPNVDVIDTGTKQFSTQVGVAYQRSSRLSFDASVSYFAIVRNSPQLLGTTGQQANGEVNYRFDRKTTIGSYYTYSHYVFPKGFGVSDSNTAGLIFSYAINRSTQVRLRLGKSSTESLGLQPIRVSPLVAALLGRPSVVISAWRQFGSSDISAQILKDLHRGRTISAAYLRGISPGNGVFQTAVQESIALSGAARVLRTYTVQFTASRDSLSSASVAVGNFRTYNALISTGRSFRGGFSTSASVGYRYFDSSASRGVRNQIQMSSGITWTPAGGKLWPF